MMIVAEIFCNSLQVAILPIKRGIVGDSNHNDEFIHIFSAD